MKQNGTQRDEQMRKDVLEGVAFQFSLKDRISAARDCGKGIV